MTDLIKLKPGLEVCTRMFLYEICNGFGGCSYNRVYVIADNDERALELAGSKFKKESREYTYGKGYYKKLEITFKIKCTEMVTEVSDEGIEVKCRRCKKDYEKVKNPLFIKEFGWLCLDCAKKLNKL